MAPCQEIIEIWQAHPLYMEMPYLVPAVIIGKNVLLSVVVVLLTHKVQRDVRWWCTGVIAEIVFIISILILHPVLQATHVALAQSVIMLTLTAFWLRAEHMEKVSIRRIWQMEEEPVEGRDREMGIF